MAKLQINTDLSAAAAIKCASPNHGEILVEPTAAELAELTESEREVIASYVYAPTYGRSPLRVWQPGWAGVVLGLRAEIEDRAERAAEKAANIEKERESYRKLKALIEIHEYFAANAMPPSVRDDIDKLANWRMAPNYSKDDAEAKRLYDEFRTMREAEFARIVSATDAALGDDPRAYIVGIGEQAEPDEAVKRLEKIKWHASTTPERERHMKLIPRTIAVLALVEQTKNEAAKAKTQATAEQLRTLIAERGTPDQLERHDAGVLPDAERKALVRETLFAPFASFAVYEEITEQEVAQDLECDLDEVKFSTREVEEFNAKDWALLQAIRKAAPDGAKVLAREHVGYERGKDDSDDPELTRLGFRVTIEFAGEKYSREFAAD